jgi:hypothetical protein
MAEQQREAAKEQQRPLSEEENQLFKKINTLGICARIKVGEKKYIIYIFLNYFFFDKKLYENNIKKTSYVCQSIPNNSVNFLFF